MKQQLQKGFTLIELMIVVAIIGILASIALPAYEDYIARAQATEAVVMMTGLKPTVIEVYADRGSFAGITSEFFGIPAHGGLTGKYVRRVGVASGVIWATFKVNKVSKGLQYKSLRLAPTDTNGIITWRCSTTSAYNVVPAVCRNTF